jgi:hypothetical protein
MSASLAHKGLPSGITHFTLANLIDKIAPGSCREGGALSEDSLGPAEVGVGRRHVARRFVVALAIIALDEREETAMS